MRKLLSLLIVAILATTTAWAAEKITDYTKIVSGKTYLIGATKSSKDYYFSVDGTKTASKAAGKGVTDANNASLFVFEGEGKNWTIKFSESENYLSLPSSKSNGNVDITSTAKNWTLSNSESLIRLSCGDFSLQSNTNTPTTFGSYKNTQTDVWLEEVAEDSRTKTSLTWSAPTATADLARGTNTFPTLTKSPESLSGITYSSSNTDVATIDETTGAITLVGEGTTTIEAAFGGDDTYAASSDKYTLRVIDNTVTPGTYTIALNNAFWGTNFNGPASGITSLSGASKGISIKLEKNNGSAMYVNDSQTRAYNNYDMTFAVPEGYEVKMITFAGTTWQSGDPTPSSGTMQNSKQWTGNANTVTISFSGTCQMQKVTITYAEASASKTATTLSFGADLDGKTITKYIGETESSFTHAATLTPAVDGASIAYSSSNENVALVSEDGSVVVANSTTDPEGTAIITAKYAGNDNYEASEASYTIDVKKLPINFSIPSESEVAAGTKLTISSIEGATLTYQFDGEDVVEVNTNTVEVTINNSCYIDVVASYKGATEEAQALYTIKKAVSSIAISGTPAKTSYKVGETFDPAGLTVTATYSDQTTEDVTADVTWSFDPATFTEATESVIATASYEGKTAEDIFEISIKKITDIAISGTPAKVDYETGEAFDPAGLTVTATYSDQTTEDVTADVTWSFDPATFTEIGEIAISVKACYKEKEATTTVNVTVAKAPQTFTIDLTKNETTTATTAKLEWAKEVVTVTAAKGSSSTAANNYYGGVNNRTSTRFYKNSTLTFTPADGITISYITYEATSNYAEAMANSTWTNATAKFNDKIVTITPEDGAQPISAKISGTTGGNSFTIYYEGAPVIELSELVENGTMGSSYTVKGGDMVAVAKIEVNDKHYVVVKDNATAVKNLSAPADNDKFFNIAGLKQQDYTQNNWMLVEMPVEQYNTVDAFKGITSISGTLTDAQNISMTATDVVVGENSEPVAINAYCPVNFMGESSVASNNAAHPANYYFATPKANEYARIVWAVYNGTDGAFYIPAHSGSVNTQDFKGGFKVDFSMNVEEAPELTDGSMYEFDAIVKEAVAEANGGGDSAPRKVEYDSSVAPSSKYVVYPINLQGSSNVVTGVSEVTGAKAVKSVRYFSVTGMEAAQPFDGLNIVVTTYTDGTTSAQKMLR